MGEVYRAHDSRLGRDVAIKFSKEQFTERFEREARAVAALNHPNICHLYDVGPNYLVMELIEGESPKGPLPLEEALRIARQIADALEVAHEKGIVHRDLKPANIKIKPDGTVKVLDFGLATLGAVAGTDPAESPTMLSTPTQAGMILGTAAYMAPEQARGKQVDKRADIWSFGVVLYELLTGERLFTGETVTDVLAAVITKEPDLSAVPPSTRRLLERCLQKDPRNRIRDIADALLLLEEPVRESTPVSRPSPLPWIAAGLMAIVAAIGLWAPWRSAKPALRPLMRLSVDLGPDARIRAAESFWISPDGTRLLNIAQPPDGPRRFALRRLDETQSTMLPVLGPTGIPFWSPDSQWIGVFTEGKLQKISVQGGAAVPLFEMPTYGGGSWSEKGFIVAAEGTGGLLRIPDTGGGATPITKLEPGEVTHRTPQVLPGGNAVLFTASDSTGAFEEARIKVVSLDTGRQKTLIRGGYFGRYIPTNGLSQGATGHLVYIHQRVLYAVPFDPARLELRGVATPVIDDVAALSQFGGAHFSFSNDGTLVYLPGANLNSKWPVESMDESGHIETLISQSGLYTTPRFSPDGEKLAVSLIGSQGQDIYIYDRKRDSLSRLTTDGQQNVNPTWAPDGQHLVYSNGSALFWVRTDGAGQPQRLYAPGHTALPFSFSPDGRRLAYWEGNDLSSQDIWTLPLDLSDPEHPKPGRPELFLRTAAADVEPAFSPDGRWIAYSSQQSGSMEVYVRPFRGAGQWQISTAGGQVPMWSRTAHQLFYRGPDGRIMLVDYSTQADSFIPSKPRVWAHTPIFYPGIQFNVDIAPDGKHFAFFPNPNAAEDAKGNVHAMFLLNFFDELRRRVPEGK